MEMREGQEVKNFKPDVPVSNMNTSNPVCPECGFSHPPPKDGECPIAKNKKASPEVRELEDIKNQAMNDNVLREMIVKTYKYYIRQQKKSK